MFRARTSVRRAHIEAVVLRADGTKEDLGVVARWHRNPFIRAAWWVQDKAQRKRRRITFE